MTTTKRTVYHGTTKEVPLPIVNAGRDNLDFVKGFYVTDIRQQAIRWAKIRSATTTSKSAILNTYSIDFDEIVRKFQYKQFEFYDEEWLQFIVDCRMGKKVWRRYGIIEGGVANDRVIDTIEAYMAGQIEKDKALRELAKHQHNNQICILKQEIIDKYFHFVKSSTVK